MLTIDRHFSNLSQNILYKIQVILNYCKDYGRIINEQKTRFMATNDNIHIEVDIRDIDLLLVDVVHTRPGYLHVHVR